MIENPATTKRYEEMREEYLRRKILAEKASNYANNKKKRQLRAVAMSGKLEWWAPELRKRA